MTEFKMSETASQRLAKLIFLVEKQVGKPDEQEPTILSVEQAADPLSKGHKMTLHLAGAQSNISITSDIEDLKVDPLVTGKVFTCINLPKFKAALSKCTVGSVTLRINHDKKSISVVSESGTVLTLSCFDTISDAEVIERIDYWNTKLATKDFTNKKTISLDADLVKLADNASKFVSRAKDASATAFDTLAVLFEGNKVKYTDRFVVFEKTLNTSVLDSFYIPRNIIEFLKPAIKEVSSAIDVNFSESETFIFIDIAELGVKAVFGIPDVTFTYPTADEYASVTPEDTNAVKLKVKKDNIYAALDKFDGIFNNTDYLWKQVRVFTNEDLLNKGLIRLQYDDYNADVDTTLEVELLSNTCAENDFNFLVPGYIIESLLDMVEEDTVQIIYSCIKPQFEHGQSMVIKTNGFESACLKLND